MFLGTVYLTFGALIALAAGLSQLACYYGNLWLAWRCMPPGQSCLAQGSVIREVCLWVVTHQL